MCRCGGFAKQCLESDTVEILTHPKKQCWSKKCPMKFKRKHHTQKKNQIEEVENSTEPDAKLLPTFHNSQIHQKEELAQV